MKRESGNPASSNRRKFSMMLMIKIKRKYMAHQKGAAAKRYPPYHQIDKRLFKENSCERLYKP